MTQRSWRPGSLVAASRTSQSWPRCVKSRVGKQGPRAGLQARADGKQRAAFGLLLLEQHSAAAPAPPRSVSLPPSLPLCLSLPLSETGRLFKKKRRVSVGLSSSRPPRPEKSAGKPPPRETGGAGGQGAAARRRGPFSARKSHALSGRSLSRSFLLLTGGACLAAGEEDVGGEDEIVTLLSWPTLST